MSYWLYILAMTFQLSAALILIFNYLLAPKEKKVARVKAEIYVENETLVINERGEGTSISDEELEYLANIKTGDRWVNIMALILAIMGYVMVIFGDIEGGDKCKAAYIMCVGTAIIVSVGLIICKNIGRKSKG